MTNDLNAFAQEWFTFALLLTAQILLVLALRRPVRAWLGAVACYRLWLLPVLWLPFYLFGPALVSMIGRFGATEAPGDFPALSSLFSLRQFMDFELLPFTAVPATGSIAGGSGPLQGWTLLAIAWAGGALALIAWHCSRWLVFSRHVRRVAMPLAGGMRETAGVETHFGARQPVASMRGINSAALFGIVKPVLLVPDDFTERYDANQRHVILAHEAVHLRRRDNAWNLCAWLLIALFWMNPLLFIAWRYFRLDQELSCDALALRRCSHEQQKCYARTLLDSLATLSTTRPQPALSAWDNLRDIRERTLMIKHHLHIARRPIAVITSLALFALTGAGLTLTFAELASPPAVAAEPPAALSQPTGRILTQAIEFLNNDQFDEARASLANLRMGDLTAFERSRVHQLLFNLEMHAEDYEGAQEQLRLALESGGLTEKETAQMQYQQAQVYVQQERYAEGAEALDRWIKSQDDANSAAYYLLAACYYYMDQYEAALPHAQTAVDNADGAPQEAWLQMLVALHMKLGQFEEAEPVVTRLAEMFPEKPAYQAQLQELRTRNAQ